MYLENEELCVTARLATWMYTNNEEGVVAHLLYSNPAEMHLAQCAKPELFEMHGPIEEGRHYRNTYARGRHFLDEVKKRYPGALSNTLG